METLAKEFLISIEFFCTTWSGKLKIRCKLRGPNVAKILSVTFDKAFMRISDVNGQAKHKINTSLSVNQWHSVEIGQAAEGICYRYYIKVDGKLEFSIKNNDARVFTNVTVNAIIRWNNLQPLYIKNLYIDSKGKYYNLTKLVQENSGVT